MHYLRQHGASVYGKTNLDEFGMGSHSTHSFYGPVKNISPFHGVSAGGSSGGSAVAVASGRCPIALGTDTGGSVRLPAAYTGIIGFKPSYGVISRWGVIPYANSMDTVGIMASGIEPLYVAFRWVGQHDPQDPTSLSRKSWIRWKKLRKQVRQEELKKRYDDKLSPTTGTGVPLSRTGVPFSSKLWIRWKRRRKPARQEGLQERYHDKLGPTTRIGVPLEYNIAELDPGIRQAWKDCLNVLQDQGATIVPVSLPNTKHALSAYYVLAPAEAASNLSKYDGVRYGSRDGSADGVGDVLYSKTRGEGFGNEVKRRILLGSYTLSSEAVDNYFLKAQKVRRLVQRDFDRAFSAPNPLRPPEQFDLSDMDDSVQMSNKRGPTQVDFIVCPTAPTLPPTLDEISNQTPIDSYMNDVFTVPASLAGLPAISVPFPIPKEFQIEGKPTLAGIQIIGQYSSDYEVIAMAEQVAQKLTLDKLKKCDQQRARGLRQQQQPQRTFRKIRSKWQVKKVKVLRFRKFVSRRSVNILQRARGKLFLYSSVRQGHKSKLRIYKIPAPLVTKYFSRRPNNTQLPREEGDSFLVSSGQESYRLEKAPLVTKYFSKGSENFQLLRGEGDSFLISASEEGYRFENEITASKVLDKPLEEKLRHVYVAQPEGRLPLTKKEIDKAFEEAWDAWLEKTSSGSQ